MRKKNDIYEIVVICDRMGVVEEITFPVDDVSAYFGVGLSFSYHVHPDSFSKALSFMLELSGQRTASNHEINFMIDGKVKTLFLSGFAKDDQFMIITTLRKDDLTSLNEDLMKINNEQINNFRLMLKETLREQEKQKRIAFDHYDEISKLNNELVNSQRDLAKKNQLLNNLNEELERIATRDPLTGLFNRRLMFEKFEEEKRRARRLGYSVCMVVIDINHFKKVNDQLGHSEGDQLLRRFAEIAMGMTRQSLDHVFRIGGDEFMMLLANCDAKAAGEIVKRIDAEFCKHTDIASLAFGVIEIDVDSSGDIDSCLMKADDLMFEHKKDSR